MKCQHCSIEIPPQFSHSINTNICAGCGGDIMDDQSVKVMAELREAMNDMPNNPDGIAGWLMSHYKLTKVGSAEPTQFHQLHVGMTSSHTASTMSKNPNVSPAHPTEPDNSSSALFNKFLARAGVKPMDKNEAKSKLRRNEPIDMDDDDMDENEEVYVPASDIDPSILMDLKASTPAPMSGELLLAEQRRREAQEALASGDMVGKKGAGFRRS